MTYVSNHTAEIGTRAPATRRPGRRATRLHPSRRQDNRIAASVAEAEAGAKLSAWRSSDGRHNNRNAKRLKREAAE